MPASYPDAVEVVFAHETIPGSTDGSYTNDPDDTGGPTKWGLSLNRFWTSPALYCWPWLSRRGVTLSFPAPQTANDVQAITREQALEVYQKCWWDYFGYGGISNQTCATKIFDAAVNMLRSAAHACAQRAATAAGHPTPDDGLFGPKTVAAINACDPKEWLVAMCGAQADYYRDLVANHGRNPKWLPGWLKRSAWPF